MAELVAIHQPNFLPWLGFFDKIARADTMVLLDSVQFPKKGGTWINRVQMLVGGKPSWVTAPVVRSYSGTRTILEMEFDESKPWRTKAVKTVQAAYGRAPEFDEVGESVIALIEDPSPCLAEYNVAAIRDLASRLGLDTKIVRSSELEAGGSATDLLVAITREAGGGAYLAGGGAEGYQEDGRFAEAGIELVAQEFQHPKYPQPAAGEGFVPGLSFVDALMSLGFDGTRELLGRS